MKNRDLNQIEELAREWLTHGWDIRLPQNCLDLIRELKFWRRVAQERVSVQVYCPHCDVEADCDAMDAYRFFEKIPRCSCGTLFQVRIGVVESVNG
jgi:hypothetical protein